MINYVTGNLLEATEDLIGHQVNCQFVMGAGLARQIKSKYPEVYKQYMSLKDVAIPKKALLGRIQPVAVGHDKTVVNIFSQFSYARHGLHTDYTALKRALMSLRELSELKELSVALPFGLGCGLAGGDWKIVSKIIEEVFVGYEVTIYKFN